MSAQEYIDSAQLCIGNALEEVDKLAQQELSKQEQETLKSVRVSLHHAARMLANIVGPGPLPTRQVNLKQINNHLEGLST